MRTLVPIVAAMLFVVVARADDQHPIDDRLYECMEADPSTAGTIQCIDVARGEWDGELNTAYRELMKRLPDAAKTKLRTAQRAWIAFRDAEHEAIAETYSGFDGTMYRPMANDAVMALTRDRARQLDAMLSTAKMAAGDEP